MFQTLQKRIASGQAVSSHRDDKTRFTMSHAMMARVRNLDGLNTLMTTQLARIDATRQTLDRLTQLVEEAQDLARKAQAMETYHIRAFAPNIPISSTTLVNGYAVGARLSLTSDTGENFTYILDRTGITWGDISDALNKANMGVRAEFVPVPNQALTTGLRFVATNGRDFRFDGISDQSVMTNLISGTSVNPATGQLMDGASKAQALFGVGGFVTVGETGLTIGFGGVLVGSKNVWAASAINAGSTLVFEDSDGKPQVLSYSTATTLQTVMDDINHLQAGIKAELVNQSAAGLSTVFSLRNTHGGAMRVLSATGSFGPAGTIGIGAETVRDNPGITTIGVPDPWMGVGIVANGSFEGGALGAGQVAPGWTAVGGGPIGLDNDPARRTHGNQYVQFGGGSNQHGGGIQQVLTTIPGYTYTVSFDLGTSTGTPGSSTPTLHAQAFSGGTVLLDKTVTVATGAAPTNIQTSFTANSAVTTFRLTDITGADALGTTLDLDVDMVQIFVSATPQTGIMSGVDYTPILDLGTQYDMIRSHMSQVLASSSDGSSVNILKGQSLIVPTGEGGQTYITGNDLSVSGTLSMSTTGARWCLPAKIQSTLTECARALSVLQDQQTQLGNWQATLKTLHDIQNDHARALDVLSDDLVGNNMADDAAQLEQIGLQIAATTQALRLRNNFLKGYSKMLP